MWFFSKKEGVKVHELKLEVLELAARVKNLEQDILSLNGRVNKRIYGNKTKDEEETLPLEVRQFIESLPEWEKAQVLGNRKE